MSWYRASVGNGKTDSNSVSAEFGATAIIFGF
jgi:hypothetical protein